MEARPRIPYLESVRDRRHVCFAEQLRSANRSITRLYSSHLGDSEIGIAQFSVLVRLYYFRQITVSRLATQLETDRTTLSRNLRLLERAGHLELLPGDDQRQRLVRLTERGFAVLEATLPHWRAAQDALQSLLGDARWEDLFSGLRQLAELNTGLHPAPAKTSGG